MRRVEIARALLHQPRLLLLDEPTVGLDIKARADILAHVRRLSAVEGIGVLWATHLIDEAGAGDDVVVLHKGSVLALGTTGDDRRPIRRRRSARRIQPVDRERRSGRTGNRQMTVAIDEADDRHGFSPAQYLICLKGIVWREALRFIHQRERFVSALVRPLVWLFIFAAGFRQVLGVSIIPPYETYVLYEVYIAPGLIAMIQLFNGMQSSLTMVYDRETGGMRTLLVSPFPRWWLLTSKLLAGTLVSVLQAYAFLLIAWFWEIEAAAARLSDAAAGAAAQRVHAGRVGNADLVADQAAREFCRRDELRHLSDVLCFFGAIPAVARQGIEPAAVLCLRA